MDEQRVEFDDFEEHFEEWLDKIVGDNLVVIITAETVPLAALIPLSLWERLQKLEERLENDA